MSKGQIGTFEDQLLRHLLCAGDGDEDYRVEVEGLHGTGSTSSTVVVIISIIELAVADGGLTVLRSFRLLRILKLLSRGHS